MKILSKLLLGLPALALVAGLAIVKPVPVAAFRMISTGTTPSVGTKLVNFYHHRHHRHYHHHGLNIHL